MPSEAAEGRSPGSGRRPGDPPPLPPRYGAVEPIGTGGMGSVVRARDLELGRTVAIKFLSPALAHHEGFRRRFRREALAAARVQHPNVVAIYDVGEYEGWPYLVMEYLPGGSLAQAMRGGPIPVSRALEWIAQAAAGLDAAHAQGVVHRDVNPANLMLDENGAVTIVDFGVARVSEVQGVTATMPGMLPGTTGYLSPEALRGEPVDRPADVYGLAVVAFELLTGRRPFGGRPATEEMSAQLHEAPPRASEVAPRVPPALDPVLERALSRDPDERPETAGAFARQLQVVVRLPFEDVGGGRRPARPRAARVAGPGRRRTPALVVAAILGLAVAGGVAAAVMTSGDDGGVPQPAGPLAEGTAPATATGAPTVAEPRAAPPPQTRAAPATTGGPATTAAPAATAPVGLAEARRLTDRAWQLIQDGQPSAAIPIMRRAIPVLEAAGDPFAGNANYNMGRALGDLGRCGEAVPFLEAATSVSGSDWQNRERARALRAARACAA
jgi:serine/threonine-protein kinase